MTNCKLSNAELCQLAKRLVSAKLEFSELWSIYNKGFLYRLFKANSDKHLFEFGQVVNEVISDKNNRYKHSDVPQTLDGEWLCFDPSSTMYDEVAEESSSGFFDSDDVPPPEFWVCFDNELLISFIPSEFLDVANQGIDNCISGSLFWMESD